MDLLKCLKEKIDHGEIKEANYIIQQIGTSKITGAFPYLIELLEITDDGSLINAIALALEDIGNQNAVDPIIRMLKHPKTQNNRGTLLYVLRVFDYSSHIDTIVDLFLHGNYESRREAFSLLEAFAPNLSSIHRNEIVEKIKFEIADTKDELEGFNIALDILTIDSNDSNKNGPGFH